VEKEPNKMGANQTNAKRRPHIRNIRIEGMMLHMRTIIEQGRTKQFLEACQQEGYETIKGQKGLVAFVRDFIDDGGDARREKSITGLDAHKFVLATKVKARERDKC